MAIFTKNKNSIITVQMDIKENGVSIELKKKGNLINLPVRLTLSEIRELSNLSTLQLVEDLGYDKKLVHQGNGHYLLSYKEVYKLFSDELKLLNLPEEPTNLLVELDNESFVGTDKFKFVLKYHTEDFQNLHKIAKRIGAIIQLPTKENILMNKDLYEFFELVERKPTEKDQVIPYIAKVKKLAENLKIPVSEHIKRENYEFIDDIDLHVERTDDEIGIIPTYKHEKLDEEELRDIFHSQKGYLKVNDKRVFVDETAIEKAKKARQIEPISKSGIPIFVQNPSAFIPEDLDISIEAFSERVKSLGIRVYKAQPFINANQAENGWFEFESGFQVKDDEGNSVLEEDDNFFNDSKDKDFKQLDPNTFIAVPENAQEFQDLSAKIKEEATTNPTSQLKPTNYILEIFENVNNLEYNEPIQKLRDSLNDQHVLEKVPPTSFKATLKPFQEDGFVWMKSLHFTGHGGLLADDMGLGKTIQVIAYLSYLKEKEQLTPTLIVLPKTLIQNWINEIRKFAPELTKNLYVHLGTQRQKSPATISQYDIVLTTYSTLTRDQLVMGQVEWKMVICDEAQAIKNPTTGASIVVKALKNKGRLALTGTPVENNLTELWSIVDFVQPGLLGSLKEFRNTYEPKLSDSDSYDDIRADLEKKIYYIYKRRTKSGELKGQLPNKFEHKIPVKMGKEQKNMYLSIIEQVKDKEIPSIQAIMKLKMLSSHPGLLEGSLKALKPPKVPKLEETLKILNGIKDTDEKVLVFTEYREMQAILKQATVNTFGIIPEIINGGTNQRQDVVDEFNQSIGFNVLILSPKAAGTGLTITSANHVIHYTRWWNPAVESQATDRVYRIGQDKNVHVYYPIVTSDNGGQSVEEVVDNLLTRKKELSENVIVPSESIDIEKEVMRQLQVN